MIDNSDTDSREPWEKARDEALDKMAGKEHYEYRDIQIAVDEVVSRWRFHAAKRDAEDDDA